jgi:hypothetical protein
MKSAQDILYAKYSAPKDRCGWCERFRDLVFIVKGFLPGYPLQFHTVAALHAMTGYRAGFAADIWQECGGCASMLCLPIRL